MNTVRILKDALELLHTKGWCKYRETNLSGQHCMIGAVHAVELNHTKANEVIDFLAYSVDPEFEPKHEYGFEVVAPWNDLLTTEFNDVEYAFKDAIKRAKELGL